MEITSWPLHDGIHKQPHLAQHIADDTAYILANRYKKNEDQELEPKTHVYLTDFNDTSAGTP